jgi:hypothetical protein
VVKVRDYRERHNHPGHTSTPTGEALSLVREYAAIVGDRAIRVRTLAGAVSVGWVDHAGLDVLAPYVATAPYVVTATYENRPYNFKKNDGYGGPVAHVVVEW